MVNDNAHAPRSGSRADASHTPTVGPRYCFGALQQRLWTWARRPDARAPLIWLAFFLALPYVVRLSAAGAWDPWETLYGEVARNILVRGDPMDLWWQAGYGPDSDYETVFNSKHALPFWSMAVSLRLFGVGGSADPAEMVTSGLAEWALRCPSLIWLSVTIAACAWLAARSAGRAAGVCCACVMATMPQLAMVGRQAITDIYMIGPVSVALVAWVAASSWGDGELAVSGRGWRRRVHDRRYLWFLGGFALAAIVPLAVLHQHVLDGDTARRVAAAAQSRRDPNIAELETIAGHLWGYWAVVVIVVLASLRWTRMRQLYMGIMYVAGGWAIMGKGFIGVGIIGAVVLLDLWISGTWGRLWRSQLLLGILIVVAVAFPWHHAMSVYRGERWFNALIIVNNVARFVSGEQPQAVGDFTFYLGTLLLGLAPWIAMLPWAMASCARALTRRDSTHSGELERIALIWLFVSFASFTYGTTKYHHYATPCAVPASIIIGLWLARAWSAPGRGAVGPQRALVWVYGLLAFVVSALVCSVLLDEPARLVHLSTYLYTGPWLEGAPQALGFVMSCLVFAFGVMAWLAGRLRMLVGSTLASGLLCTWFLLVDFIPAASENWSQRSMFERYYAQRGARDVLASWWFFHRGETFYSKADVWMMVKHDKAELRGFIEERQKIGGAIWFVTTASNIDRLGRQLPEELRGRHSVEYQNFHHALIRVPLEPPSD